MTKLSAGFANSLKTPGNQMESRLSDYRLRFRRSSPNDWAAIAGQIHPYATVKARMNRRKRKPPHTVPWLRRVRAGGLPVGYGLLLWAPGDERNERGVHGALPLSVRVPGMVPVMLVNRVRLTGEEIRLLLISAAFGVPVQFLIQFHGLARTTVSHASLMVGSMPVLLAAAAALFAGERLDRVGWVALVASTIGAALIVLGGTRARRPWPANPDRRSDGGGFTLHGPGMDSAEQEADAHAQPAGGDGVHHPLWHSDAGGVDSGPWSRSPGSPITASRRPLPT